jgi:membrane-bound lytic murein transglycosylase D
MPAQAFLLSDEQNLWPVMSQNFTISNELNHSPVQRQIDQDLNHPKYLHKLTRNAKPYLYFIYQETQKKHLPAELALLPMIESEYLPKGRSDKGAVGLWQLMPETAHNYGIKMNMWYDGRQNTIVSTKAALNFLSYLYEQFDHNWLLALAAYNAGPGTVMAAMHYNEEHGRPTDFWALHLPKETREYIPKLLALAAIIQNPKEYGVNLAPVPNKPLTTTVTIKKQMPLKTIATMAHTSVNTVKKLNPALKKQVTPPHQVVTLVLPANKKPAFEKDFKNQATDHYTVQHGDSLKSIASKYKTTIHALEEMNQIHGGLIHIHQALMVPKVITQTAKEMTTAAKNKSVKSPQVNTSAENKNQDTDENTVSADSDEHEYTVKRGDNIHKLAERFDTTSYHIMKHNHLKTVRLSIGQHLMLPHA